MICELCKEEFESLKGLHAHLKKSHKVSQESYYHVNFPRYDLSDGELIYYKDYEQYFSSKFNSRESFIKWASDLSSDSKRQEVKDYCVNFLLERKRTKSLVYLPSHVELKSLMMPSIYGLSKIFGSNVVSELKQKTGLLPRFSYSEKPKFDESECTFYVDTREQLELTVANKCAMKLSVGDYTVSSPLYSDLFIERKSLNDLAGTLSSGFDRFTRELERAKSLGAYLVILVEEPYSEALNYSPYTSFAKKINGQFLFHKIRSLMTQFDGLQFVFCSNRKHSLLCLEKIFRMKHQAKIMDLEYLKDGNII